MSIKKYSRTEQLFNKNDYIDAGTYYIGTNKLNTSNNTKMLLIPCEPNTTYTVSRATVITHRLIIGFVTSSQLYADMPVYGQQGSSAALTATSTSGADSAYLCVYYGKSGGSDSSTPEELQAQLDELMVNEGVTALPYQPYYDWITTPYRKYETATDTITTLPKTIIGDGRNISAYTIKGNMSQSGTPTPSSPITPSECGDLVTSGQHSGEYVISITLGGNNYPVYLSEPLRKIGDYADTIAADGTVTRVIKKLVLDGTEDWHLTNGVLYLAVSGYQKISGITCACTHYPAANNVSGTAGVVEGTVCMGTGTADRLFIKDSQFSSAAVFEQYLVGQYTAGTPLTVWYVLATAETETITAPSIPTTGTAESFDVDTTLKPSEVSLTYHGWHEHSDTKYTT